MVTPFPQHPAPGRPLTSVYGERFNRLTGRWEKHHGLDWGGEFPVLAADRGLVILNYYSPLFGWVVLIEHSKTLRTKYAHGAHQSPLKRGRQVARRQVVYVSGSTGMSTGKHLHFEVHELVDGVWQRVDPAPYLQPRKPTPPPKEDEDDMKPFMIHTKTKTGARWAHISGDLQTAVELSAQDSANAIGREVTGSSIEVTAAEFERYLAAARSA